MIFAIQVFLLKLKMTIMSKLFAFIPHGKPVLFTGESASAQLCENIAYFGHKKVLIVTDEMLVGLGVIDPMIEVLKARGVSTVVYDGVEPNPTYLMVEEGTEVFKNNKCDAILAVGGGSPIDTAKAISLLVSNSHLRAIQLSGPYRGKRAPVKMYAVPTTAGTGSEVTLAAVISNPKTHEKLFIADHRTLPVAAALDVSIMKSMPAGVTAATGMDALTHAVEAYLSTIATGVTNHFALAAVRIVFQNLERAYVNGEDLKAREGMALASFYAGFAFSRALLGYVHGIAHQFGGFYGTPHGMANALVLPHILDYSRDAASAKLAKLARAIGLDDGKSDDLKLAQMFIDKVYELRAKVGIPNTLSNLKEHDIPNIAKAAIKESHASYPVPRYMDSKTCEGIIHKLLPNGN